MENKDKHHNSKQWHKRMAVERRCQWCGKPSSPDYASACEEHKDRSRQINARSKQRQKQERKAKGLCLACGKNPARDGRTSCGPCSLKFSIRNKAHREHIAQKKYDKMVDHGIIGVGEAAKSIGCSYAAIHYLISIGRIKVVQKSRRRLWLDERDVTRYVKSREKRLLISIYCRACGYKWHPVKIESKSRRRCPVCRSSKITVNNKGTNPP